MSEKIKVVQAEPVEEVIVVDKKRDWKKIATGIGIGAVVTVVAAVIVGKLNQKDDDDFDNETIWTPLTDLQENSAS